jgi:small subunit ribosomal protein S9
MTKKTDQKYFEAVGRRKTAIARVRLMPASKTSYIINDRSLEEYFKTDALRESVVSPFKTVEGAHFTVSVKVVAGGPTGQAEAIAMGIGRALVKADENNKTVVKQAGLLRRDPRAKERRKFGLKKARKSPSWSKR